MPEEEESPEDNQTAVEEPVSIAPIDDRIRVGFLVPLSGQHKAVGEALLNAAQLALFDLADDRFHLLIGDTQGTPEGALFAARSLLDQGAQLLLGPLFADSVRQVGQEVLYRNASVIGFSNDQSVAAPGIYVLGLSPEAQIDRMVAFASAQGLFRIATLVPDNLFGRRALEALQSSVFFHGAELAAFGIYDPAAEDLTSEVIKVADYDRRHKELLEEREKLEEQGDEAAEALLEQLGKLDTLSPPEYDAILLPFGGRQLLTMASLFAFYDVDPVDVRYLGTNLWDDPALLREPTLRGGWFPAPPPQLWDVFKSRYETTFGEAPPRIASLGYDATALAAILAQQAVDVAPEIAQQVPSANPNASDQEIAPQTTASNLASTHNAGSALTGTGVETSKDSIAASPGYGQNPFVPGRSPTFRRSLIFTEEKITNPNGFAGIDGIFRFLSDGRVERVYSVFEVRSNGFAEIDPARTTFEEIIF
ncbi:MAG: penicillin-binding protein activator [Kiloniellales bacterium]|nr:penicillin-binding protein activator [Kiloniellales bacterium]